MKYKGYIATIEYDESVDLLHGRVINAGASPVATFEASDVEGLKREFRTSIDQYLALCEEKGIQPQKPFSGKALLRLGPSLHGQVTLAAMEDGMTLNAWIKKVLEEKVMLRM
jgi:predicted HicB family RNase H-like nuclease